MVVLLMLVGMTSTASAQLKPGDSLPNFVALGLEGELPDLSGKIVVLDVWASWCAPCKASFPELDRLQQEFGPAGVVVLALSVDRKPRDYQGFIARFKPSFSVMRDAEQRFAALAQPPAMPTTYVADRSGRVRTVHTGFHGASTTAELRAQLQQLVEEKL